MSGVPPAVVLAAGFGSRLTGHGSDLPKALVPLRGRPLLSYTLEGLARAGVRRAYVVVGHRGDLVADALASSNHGLEVSPIYNPQFELPNGSSLAAARSAVEGEAFLLLMADHLLGAEAVGRMLAAPFGFAVGVERGAMPEERLVDATKVRLDERGLVQEFGKRLTRWDAVDAGIFRCLPSVFSAIDELGAGSEVGAIMTVVARREPFHAVDLTGAFWLDVDTPKDLADAERLLGG
jgi:choline kinase